MPAQTHNELACRKGKRDERYIRNHGARPATEGIGEARQRKTEQLQRSSRPRRCPGGQRSDARRRRVGLGHEKGFRRLLRRIPDRVLGGGYRRGSLLSELSSDAQHIPGAPEPSRGVRVLRLAAPGRAAADQRQRVAQLAGQPPEGLNGIPEGSDLPACCREDRLCPRRQQRHRQSRPQRRVHGQGREHEGRGPGPASSCEGEGSSGLGGRGPSTAAAAGARGGGCRSGGEVADKPLGAEDEGHGCLQGQGGELQDLRGQHAAHGGAQTAQRGGLGRGRSALVGGRGGLVGAR
mmetsp:Transcript_161140/g.517178  ORF Transcript_161140/g.517178 Transcript_161140/m.517178 type:complete len:293 (+) Transcript_161140:1023-1901(+)